MKYLATEPMLATLLLFVPMMILFPFSAFVAFVLTEDGEMTWITGTLFDWFDIDEDELTADNTFNGRDVVDIVMRFGVELPIDFWGFAMTEAAFASNDPVRLLKAGTVVNWTAAVDAGTFVIVVAEKWVAKLSLLS